MFHLALSFGKNTADICEDGWAGFGVLFGDIAFGVVVLPAIVLKTYIKMFNSKLFVKIKT